MKLHEKQKEIIKTNARFKVIRAGRRSGKTVLQIESMVFDAVNGKDRNVFYIAPTQKQARSIIWVLLLKRLHGIGKFNEQRLECVVPTVDGGHSYIQLAGWEKRENFRGLSAYSLTFDEVDTMRDFLFGWGDIFRPTLIDSGGSARFIGTPKKENPNLRMLEKIAKDDSKFACFHFTTYENPFIPDSEREELEDEYKNNHEAYKQEILAEHIENKGALFGFDALTDVFSNTIEKDNNKYMIVDVADVGNDKTVFSFWDGLEEYRREIFDGINTEDIVNKIREYAQNEKIPYSHIAVDAIGVGAGVASNSMLAGIIGFKSSYPAIKTDHDIIRTANESYLPDTPILTTDYKNLRSQCVFTLAELVNERKIASKVTSRKERIIEELSSYQDISKGDGKRMVTPKEDIKKLLNRSPDESDTWIMRMYFEIKKELSADQNPHEDATAEQLKQLFNRNRNNRHLNSSK